MDSQIHTAVDAEKGRNND